jgi:O-antigen ligase
MFMDVTAASDAFLVLLAAVIALPFLLAACWRQPTAVTLGFITILILFSSSTWGQLQEENTLYARGTGLFYFSLINLLLWVAVAAAATHQSATSSPQKQSAPFSRFLAAFAFLLLAHVVVGLAAGKELILILSYNGLLNILNLLLFSWLLLSTLTTHENQQSLIKLMLILAGVRALFGLIRYQWFEGDSANPYRNFESLDMKLVFFDIGDNYIAALAAFCLAWLLLMPTVRLKLWQRIFISGWLVTEIATVALSFRRSSLIGLALMTLVLVWQLPWRRRVGLVVVSTVAMMTASATLLRERLQFNVNSQSTGFISSLLYDIGPDRATETSRFYELESAARSLEGNWWFGLGSWGSFYGNEDILDYHFGKFDFVHSGFGHVILKSGILGLTLFLGLLFAFIIHYLQRRKFMSGTSALLADAGFAGFLFWIPTLLIGTPIIEFRSMLLIGFTLALPYLHSSHFHSFNPRSQPHHAIA